MTALSFDELNQLIDKPRSMDYKKYFGEMRISEEQKEKRIALAERLESYFLPVMILLFTMYQYNSLDYERVRTEFENAYKKALDGYMDIDSDIMTYIITMSQRLTDSTESHKEEPYYYSEDRAKYISEEESSSIWNNSEFKQAITEGKTKKQWLTMKDNKVRKTHRKVDEKTIPINSLFMVGDSLLMYPRDTSYGASDSEIIGCRCSVKYL